MSFDKIRDYIVMNITLNIFIIAALPDLINSQDFIIQTAKAEAIPLYGTLTIFLVFFYLRCDDKYLNKKFTKTNILASIVDFLLRLNLLSTCLFFLLVIYSHSFVFNQFIAAAYLEVLALTIVSTIAIPVVLLLALPIIIFLISKFPKQDDQNERSSYEKLSWNLKTSLEVLKEIENNFDNQQTVITDINNKIMTLNSQVHKKDIQIEKLTENMQKQAINLQTFLNQKAIEAPGTKNKWWQFW